MKYLTLHGLTAALMICIYAILNHENSQLSIELSGLTTRVLKAELSAREGAHEFVQRYQGDRSVDQATEFLRRQELDRKISDLTAAIDETRRLIDGLNATVGQNFIRAQGRISGLELEIDTTAARLAELVAQQPNQRMRLHPGVPGMDLWVPLVAAKAPEPEKPADKAAKK